MREGGHAEVELRYCRGFLDRGMPLDYAWLAWRRYLARSIYVNAILTLAEQTTLAGPASVAAGVALADVAVSAGRWLQFL